MHFTKKENKKTMGCARKEEVTTLWEGCGWPWFGHGPSFLYNPQRRKRKKEKEKKKHFDIYIGRSPKE